MLRRILSGVTVPFDAAARNPATEIRRISRGAGADLTAGTVTGVLALVAFFAGGLTAGASMMWQA